MSAPTTGVVRALVVAIGLTIASAGGIAAQSPAPPAPSPLPSCGPSGPVCPTPTPTPTGGIEWPPMGFAGTPPGQPFTFTSGCGVWGRDPIALHGQGGGWTFELVVTFDTYDQEAFQWSGRVTGTSKAPNGTVATIDEPALIYYDPDGRWVLVASWAAQIPALACAQPSPSEAAAPGRPGGAQAMGFGCQSSMVVPSGSTMCAKRPFG